MKPKIIFLLASMLLSSWSTLATTDSLLATWENQNAPLTIRVEAYVKFIYQGIYDRPLDSSTHLTQALTSMAENARYPLAKAYALLIQSDIASVAKDNATAFEKANQSLHLFVNLQDKKGEIMALSALASLYGLLGDIPTGLAYDLRALAVAREIDYKESISHLLLHISYNYYQQENYEKGLQYTLESMQLLTSNDPPTAFAHSMRWIGKNHLGLNNYDSAFHYLNQALVTYQAANSAKGVGLLKTDFGEFYEKKADYERAMTYLLEAISIFESQGNSNSSIAQAAKIIGRIYSRLGAHQKSLTYCKRSYDLLEEANWLSEQLLACICVYDAYKALGNQEKALEYLEKKTEIEKQLQKEEVAKQLERMEFKNIMLADSLVMEEERRRVQREHETEVQKKTKSRNIAISIGLFFLLLAGGFYSRWRYVRKSRDIISKERDRSDSLLLNILPAEIAAELKEKGRADARDFEMVSILFTDFKGFTEQSASMSAASLVNEINVCFEAFDKIIEKYGIEKIKTIGDAYMAAGGLPVPTDDSVKITVLAALEMQEFISMRKTANDSHGLPAFEMRVGIHTGPVVAGIVGVKKFQYDIWGDTVNTAARMEQNGEVGKVNISQSTYNLIKDERAFAFEGRGKVEAKGKGEVEMWFVTFQNHANG